MKKNFQTTDIVFIGIMAALIAICSWISIPTTVPFTLQTFAVFLAVGLLGGRNGALSVLIYILLGAVGLPVFSGFKGGPAALFGTTGGYILGFLLSALIVWLFEKLLGKKIWVYAISMFLGLIACYAVGTIWFMIVYAKNTGAITLATTLSWCVIPFIIPDIIKIVLALILSNRISKYIKRV